MQKSSAVMAASMRSKWSTALSSRYVSARRSSAVRNGARGSFWFAYAEAATPLARARPLGVEAAPLLTTDV
ncbi:unnamed protein product [Pelagomonas calceolata]|uniref:Uncharacterized protein n=1 Tax=Pelagomonas calceolata TaxID=35677 RepID=A0A8J2T318_9STRA|nr:unnamed protein product [Pelagomonas calceolata]